MEKKILTVITFLFICSVTLIAKPDSQSKWDSYNLAPSAILINTKCKGEGTIEEGCIIGTKFHHTDKVKKVKIGDDCYIGAGTIIGTGCDIGDHVEIAPRCIIYPNITISDSVEITVAGTIVTQDM